LPNILAPVIVQGSLLFASAIITESYLSFLGLGAQPPTATWGNMLRNAIGFMELAPWLAVFPGAAIFLTVLGCNLLGDGLRDRFDPRD
jgi:peptide/nickel transport system permease protein